MLNESLEFTARRSKVSSLKLLDMFLVSINIVEK